MRRGKGVTSRIVFIIGICLFMVLSQTSEGATITAVNNGPWSANSTWSCNCQPGNGDNVIIPAGKTVSITAGPVILTGGPVITITIAGTLSLNTGGTLIVDANDIVKVLAGGKISGTGILDAVWSGGTPVFVANGTSINGPSTITSGSLPITLLFFRGEVDGLQIKLEWASASEKNFDYYAIERSADGINFSELTQVKGAGNSTVQLDYSYNDTQPISGTSYYRIKSVDFDRSTDTFPVIRMFFGDTASNVQVFPNPVVNGNLNIKLNFYPAAGSDLLICNIYGSQILHQSLDSAIQEYQLEIPNSSEKGIYFVKISSGTIHYSSTIMVH